MTGAAESLQAGVAALAMLPSSAVSASNATVNALFGNLKRFAVDYRVIPWCTFIDPEVARVGLNDRIVIELDGIGG